MSTEYSFSSSSDETLEVKTAEAFFISLPPEIVDYILDIATLPSNRGILRLLCLVSKAVYYIASARLFRNILLGSDIEVSLFHNALSVSPSRGVFTRSLAVRYTSRTAQIISLEKLLYRLPNIRTLNLRDSPSVPQLPVTHPTLRCIHLGLSYWNFKAIFPSPCSYITHIAFGTPENRSRDQINSIRFEQLTHILFTNPWPGILGHVEESGLSTGFITGMDGLLAGLPVSIQIFICWEVGPTSKLPKLLNTHYEAVLRDLGMGKTDSRFILAAPESWGTDNDVGGIDREWTNWVLVWNFAKRGPWFTGKWTVWDEAEQLIKRRAVLHE